MRLRALLLPALLAAPGCAAGPVDDDSAGDSKSDNPGGGGGGALPVVDVDAGGPAGVTPCTVSLSGASGERTLEYDADDFLLRDTRIIESGETILDYSWDDGGLRSVETSSRTESETVRSYEMLPTGRRIARIEGEYSNTIFNYDAEGLLTSGRIESKSGTTWESRSYEEVDGRLIKASAYGSSYGLRNEFLYDDDGLLEKRVLHVSSVAGPFSSLHIPRDEMGWPTAFEQDTGDDGSIDKVDQVEYEGDCTGVVQSWWLTGEPGAER